MIADYEEIPYSDDINLRKEYLSKIDKGAYLHKYAGLWALGLDLLPSSPQRLLHLFVYRGCACGIDAFVILFSTPTTKKFNMILPKRPKFDEFNEKDCTKEFANNTLISLGDISKLKFGLIISLKLWTGINGNNGKIEFLNGIDGKVEFGIYFDNNGIKSIPVMNDKGLNKTMENLMVSGVEISMTITLAKYFLWVTIQIKRKLIFSSFWPDNWWEGNFFEGVDDVHMRIDGDFFVTSHPNLKKMTKQKIKNKVRK
uniref:DUF4283 domain-containing protein n=1 Tax=Meloidogyne hapla TaxID=6305 RepID=A0A1I8BC61_MELHA